MKKKFILWGIVISVLANFCSVNVFSAETNMVNAKDTEELMYYNSSYDDYMNEISNLPADEYKLKSDMAPSQYCYNEKVSSGNTKKAMSSYYSKYDSELALSTQDQGNPYIAQSGWAFGVNNALEAAILQNEADKTYNFSEQHLRYAINKDSLGTGYENYGVNSGGTGTAYFSDASAYWTRNNINGPVAENLLPYNVNKNEEINTLLNSKKEDFTVTDTITLSSISRYADEDEINDRVELIKSLVMNYGAVYIAYDHYDGAFNSYMDAYNNNNGEEITRGKECANGVVIVGWDDSYSANNFGESKPTMNGAFIVKANRLVDKDPNNADIEPRLLGRYYLSYNMTPYFYDYGVVKNVESGKYDIQTYEYDKRRHKGVSYNDLTSVVYANKYENISGESRLIKSITTYAEAPSSSFNVYISNTGKMEDLKEVGVENSNVTYMGYNTFKLKDEILVDGTFIVAIKVSSSYNLTKIIPQEVDSIEDSSISGRCFVSESVDSMKNSNYEDTGSHNNIIKVHTINADRVWDFSDEKFVALGDSVSKTTTVDGLTIGYESTFRDNYKDVKGQIYKRNVDLIYSSDTDKRSLSFCVDGPSNIYFIAQTNKAGQARNLEVYSYLLDKKESISVNEASGYCYKYRGGAGKIRVRAEKSTVRIYSIIVENYNEYKYEYLEDYSERKWDFKNLVSNEVITSYKNIDGLGIYATVNKPVELIVNNCSNLDGFKFSNAIDLNGVGDRNSRTVAFDVKQNSYVYITARSLSRVERNLILTDKYCCNLETDDNIQSFRTGDNIKTYKFLYTGDDTTIYIRSDSEAIRIYEIAVRDSYRKITDDIECVISDRSEFIIGQKLDNTIVNGFTFISGKSPTTVVAVEDSNYSKAVNMIGDRFDSAGKIRFNISDSSGIDNNTKARKVKVVAKSSGSSKLVLANKYGYIYGSQNMSNIINEYSFDYTDKYDEVYIFVTNGTCEIYSISDVDIRYKADTKIINLNVKNGETYRYSFNVENAPASDVFDYIVEYDASKLKIVHIGKDNNFTGGLNTDTSINNVRSYSGKLTFNVKQPQENWSGIATSVVFEGVGDGASTIKFSTKRRTSL